MNLGKNVKNLREGKNITQKELADEVGVTQSMLNQIEKGVKIPSLATALDIAKVLDTTVDYLTYNEVAS